MISVILQVGAVPFGQAIDMGRGDVKCCRIGAHTPSTVEWQNLRLGKYSYNYVDIIGRFCSLFFHTLVEYTGNIQQSSACSYFH